MSLLRRLLGVSAFLGGGSLPSDGGEKEDSWGQLDGSWFEGNLLSYRDPLSYLDGSLEHLISCKRDVIWLERPAEPYPMVSQFHSFHDQAARPVCEEIPSGLPSTKPAAYIMGRSDVALSGYRTATRVFSNREA
jgi:hypothetical protein